MSFASAGSCDLVPVILRFATLFLTGFDVSEEKSLPILPGIVSVIFLTGVGFGRGGNSDADDDLFLSTSRGLGKGNSRRGGIHML